MLSEALKRAKNGDAEAFGILYDASYDTIYRTIFYRVLDGEMTEDIISEVYMKSFRQIHTCRGETEGEFFGWLRRIAYTTMIDMLRDQREKISLDELTFEPHVSSSTIDDIDRRDTLRKIIDYLDTLSERDRHIVTLRIWEDLSYEEIAHITGESLSNAKKIVSRTLAKITANIQYLFFLITFLAHVITR